MPTIDGINEFFDWWWDQMRLILRTTWPKRPAFFSARKADTASLRMQKASSDPSRILVLNSGSYVIRKLSDNKLPLTRAHEIALLDIKLNTPFKNENIHFIPFNAGPEGEGAYCCIIKRNLLEKAITESGNSGFIPEKLAVERDGHIEHLPARTTRAIFRPGREQHFFRNIGAIAVASLCIASYFHLYFKLEIARSQLNHSLEEIENREIDAISIIKKKKFETEYALKAELHKDGSIFLTTIVEEISEEFPDSSWLSELKLENGAITISGISDDAASLIPVLNRIPGVRQASLVGPVSRFQDGTREKFEITFRVAQ